MAQKKKPNAKNIQEAWDAEIARRIQDLDSGKAKTSSMEEVRQRLAAKFPKEH